jgi:hypothetical protein
VKLQSKPEKWLCAVTAFAMVLDEPVADVRKLFKHSGDEIIFPDLSSPQCRRGHNPYDFIPVALRRGYAMTPVPLRPTIQLDSFHQCEMGSELENYDRFSMHVKFSKGLLEMVGQKCGHMVAYDYGTIFDPDGDIYVFSLTTCQDKKLSPFRLWRMDRIEKPA